MILLIIITILSCILAFSHELSRPIKAYLQRPSKEELKVLSEISILKGELAKISMRSQYIEYIRTERKIFELEQELGQYRGSDIGKNLLIEFGVGYGTQAFISFVLLIASIAYRNEPIVIFDKRFNFSPFGGFISFPTGVEGAISVPFWIFVSSFTFRSVAGMLN